jgi:predicted alpha/beta-hydrolase family hydrolase
MRDPFMEAMATRLGEREVATLRYEFPYMQQGRRRPGPRGLLIATVRSALGAAARVADGLPVFAGGKSMGGRMTSLAVAEKPIPELRGVIFVGFPLHPADKPGTERGEHLARVGVPMLFLQGTRDRLADLDLLTPLCSRLGERATLRIIENADHSFHVLKRSGRGDDEVLSELAGSISQWMSRHA